MVLSIESEDCNRQSDNNSLRIKRFQVLISMMLTYPPVHIINLIINFTQMLDGNFNVKTIPIKIQY